MWRTGRVFFHRTRVEWSLENMSEWNCSGAGQSFVCWESAWDEVIGKASENECLLYKDNMYEGVTSKGAALLY